MVGGVSETQTELFEAIGRVTVGELEFELYEGAGGHVAGETVIAERGTGLVFTGDIFVNIKGFTKEQSRFNRLAPYLMTSVDTDPELAKREREALPALLGRGKWTVVCGHGGVTEMEITE